MSDLIEISSTLFGRVLMSPKRLSKKLLVTALLAAGISTSTSACTGITLATTHSANIHARTIEWGENNLNSKLIVSPRDYAYTSTLPNGKKGLSWRSKYGFSGLSVTVDKFIAEGVNEAGLTAGLFYFKGYGSLATFDPSRTGNNIVDMDFVRWMLSQFATVAEMEAALKNIKIVPVYIDAKGNPTPTAHWRVTDNTGRNVVIEIVDNGKINIYENTAGVLTNSPEFPWQVTNLSNYINIAPGTTPDKKTGGLELTSFGTGTAAGGLPGDISPVSRFVRAAFYVHTAPPLTDNQAAVSQALHILNNFDIPVGVEFAPDQRSHIPDLPSATQWTSVIDQQNRVLYFKTMNDSRIKQLDLKTVDFSGKEEIKRPMDSGQFTVEPVSL